MDGLTFKTNFGIDYRNDYSYSMTKNNPEFSESGGQNNFYESNYFNYRWVWTNTLSFSRTFNEIHSLNILLGTEAIRDGLGRSLNARRYNYLFEDNTNTYTLDMARTIANVPTLPLTMENSRYLVCLPVQTMDIRISIY